MTMTIKELLQRKPSVPKTQNQAKPDVLVVLTNWVRPDNVVKIVSAFRSQTVPVQLVLVDNSPHEYEEFWREHPDTVSQLDDYWRFLNNAGPPCRFAPAWMRHDHKYVLFYDDDLLPGPRAVEYLLDMAESVKDAFATIGEIGRRFRQNASGEWQYVARNIGRGPALTPVDCTCRAHFVCAEVMSLVLQWKWQLLSRFGDDGHLEGDRRGWWREDDFLLSLGIQAAMRWPSYLTPAGPPETQLKYKGLPAPNAHCARQFHCTDRDRHINMAAAIGWRSLIQETTQATG